MSGEAMRAARRCFSTPAPARAAICPGSICSARVRVRQSDCGHHPFGPGLIAMRTFGFAVNKRATLAEMRIPSARLARVNQSLKRRLDDDVEEVFHRACATNDLEAAADLLALLEKWHARRSASYGRERRITGAALQRAHKELTRLTALHGAEVKPDSASATLALKSGDAA